MQMKWTNGAPYMLLHSNKIGYVYAFVPQNLTMYECDGECDHVDVCMCVCERVTKQKEKLANKTRIEKNGGKIQLDVCDQIVAI